MPAPQLQLVTFQEFAKMAYQLAELIKQENQADPIELIISINRGGAVLSRILSDYLNVEIAAFGMASYSGINNQKEIRISQELNRDLKDKNVLLVDEICDSGKTFIKAVEIAEHLQPRKVLTATMFTKPHAIFAPNYSVAVSDKWVVFPYEVRETLTSLDGFFKNDPQIRQQLTEYFLNVGINQDELNSLEKSLNQE